jgi:hypothetical protein
VKPTVKSEQISKVLNDLYDREEKVTSNLCVFCGKRVTSDSFRNLESQLEYATSGLCQVCQDEFFELFGESIGSVRQKF